MEWLKKRRNDLNYTQQEMAKLIGVSKRQYIRYELNERPLSKMELETFLKLVEALHYSFKYTLDLYKNNK